MKHPENCICLDCNPDQETPFNEYRCHVCKRRFASGWSEEERDSEYLKNYGENPEDSEEDFSFVL